MCYVWVTALQLWLDSNAGVTQARKSKAQALLKVLPPLSRLNRVAFSRRMSTTKMQQVAQILTELHNIFKDHFPDLLSRPKAHILFAHLMEGLTHYTAFVASAEASESLNAVMRAAYQSGNRKAASMDVAKSVAAHLTATVLLGGGPTFPGGWAGRVPSIATLPCSFSTCAAGFD
jgi:hypothetical protein